MWILFGGRTKAIPIEGGRVALCHCPDCAKVMTFVEADVLDKFEVFFVSLLDMRSRRMVCKVCGHDVDPAEVSANAPASSGAPLQLRARASAPRAPAAAAKPALPARKAVRPDDQEIDEELAALKARLGK